MRFTLALHAGRFVVASGLLLMAAWGSAAEPSPPQIAASGPTVASFVPPGFRIEQKTEVDLNGDGLRDAALLIVPQCGTDPETSGFDKAECEAEGRMLVIVFQNVGGGYRLSVSKEITSGVGVHGDHFGGMKVHGRTLSFAGGAFSCAGQTGRDLTFQYRYQEGDWFLIGSKVHDWHAPAACNEKEVDSNRDYCPELKLRPNEVCVAYILSVNYNTGMQETKWSVQSLADEDGNERTVFVRKRFEPKPLTRLVDVPFEF